MATSGVQLLHLRSAQQLRDVAAAWDNLWERSAVTLPTARASMVAQLRNNDSVRGSLSLVIEQWSRGSGQVLDPVREDGDSLAAHLRRALQN